MSETKNDSQDVALENNDEASEAEDVEESQDDNTSQIEALQQQLEEQKAEAAKFRRMLEKQQKKSEVRKAKTEEPADDDSLPVDLDYGEKAYLRSALNLKGADELQLAREWKSKYGTSVEEMEGDEVFLNKLTNLREARESQAALPKGNKRSGQSGTTDLDIAIAKFKDTGELPSDFATRSKVVSSIAETEKTEGVFSGPAVIGPTMQ